MGKWTQVAMLLGEGIQIALLVRKGIHVIFLVSKWMQVTDDSFSSIVVHILNPRQALSPGKGVGCPVEHCLLFALIINENELAQSFHLINLSIIKYHMLFGGRSVSPINTRVKGSHRQVTKSPSRKEPTNTKSELKTATAKAQQKTKQNTGILYLLEDIYNQLNFSDYDAFPHQRIIEARKNIERLSAFFVEEPICPKHRDLLNLYCETDKQVICVSCVYKGSQDHKGHKIRPIDTIDKTIELDIIRSEEKAKGLVNQLTILQNEIKVMEKDICENFMNISNNSMTIINETIKQLELMKEEYDQKLSLAYRRTNTIVKRYNECLDLMISTLEANLKKSSTMKGLSKYLLLKQVNKENGLIEDLIAKFNENRVLMDQWKRSMKETDRIITRKKKQVLSKDDVYIVTQF